MQDDAYQQEYDKAAAALEAAANGAKPEAITAPEEKQPEPVKVEEAATEAKAAEPEIDPVAELRTKLEKTEKALKDTQAWGTKNAQRLKEIEQERERQQREANKPAILDANPELEEAIRHVTRDPRQEELRADQQKQREWMGMVEAAHPGIFSLPNEDELVKAVLARRETAGVEWDDPLVAIREITAEKLALTERQVGKKFMAEAAKKAQKSAMSVPGAGASAVNTAPVDPQKEMADRYLNMGSAEFEKERRRVLGL